jgi:hypothetical protein
MSVEIHEIKIGDRVKSYDFPMHLEYGDLERAEMCFVEGVVSNITNEVPDGEGWTITLPYHVYVIDVIREVFNGEETVANVREQITAPINGQSQMMSDHPTHGVRKVA